MNQTVRAGLRLPLPNQRQNFLSLSYSRIIVKVINAFLNLRAKNGQLLLSDYNGLLQFDTDGGTTTIVSDNAVPWQITSISAGVISVAPGVVLVEQTLNPDITSGNSGLYNPVGTDTNISLPSGINRVWLKLWNDGGTLKAEIQTPATVSYPPSGWIAPPLTQGFDLDWPNTDYSTGFIMLGYVDTTVSPNVVVQYVFDTPHVPDLTGNRVYTYNGPWSVAGTYRNYAVVKYSGTTYYRAGNLTLSNNGGEPGVGVNDWFTW